ncbi:hypothetical protein LX32DRAFT_731331, partial [Colletotrichum zoysiae]
LLQSFSPPTLFRFVRFGLHRPRNAPRLLFVSPLAIKAPIKPERRVSCLFFFFLSTHHPFLEPSFPLPETRSGCTFHRPVHVIFASPQRDILRQFILVPCCTSTLSHLVDTRVSCSRLFQRLA